MGWGWVGWGGESRWERWGSPLAGGQGARAPRRRADRRGRPAGPVPEVRGDAPGPQRHARRGGPLAARGARHGGALVRARPPRPARRVRPAPERGADVSPRTVLSWVHTFGPLLAAALRRRARPLGRRWYVGYGDETYVRVGRGWAAGGPRVGRGWAYRYRAVDETGQVVDVLLREHRDLDRARAFLQQARRRHAARPATVGTAQHAASGRAVRRHVPLVAHVRPGPRRSPSSSPCRTCACRASRRPSPDAPDAPPRPRRPPYGVSPHAPTTCSVTFAAAAGVRLPRQPTPTSRSHTTVPR